MNGSKRNVPLQAAALVAVLFGAVTIVSGGRVLFGDEVARQEAGAIVAFVLWFNFCAGFAYVVAGLGLWRRRRWSVPFAAGIAVATALVFVAFGVHVLTGGAYEPRTAGAMLLRTLAWVAIAWIGYREIRRRA